MPVIERAAYPFGLGVCFIASGEILGGRYALPRDTAMTNFWMKAMTNRALVREALLQEADGVAAGDFADLGFREACLEQGVDERH